MTKLERPWFMYVVRCADDSLYCGITTDTNRRMFEHNDGRGSKYVYSHKPFKLVYQKEIGNHSQALRAESKFKKLTREEKLKYIQ